MHHARLLLAALAVCGCRSTAHVVIDDHFDDGDPVTNTRGTGHGWYSRGSGPMPPQESASVLRLQATSFANRRLISNERDNFPFWNDTGATYTWHIKKTAMPTPHKSRRESPSGGGARPNIVWYRFAIASAKLKNTQLRGPVLKGGMEVHIGFNNSSSDPLGLLIFGNKNTRDDSEEETERTQKTIEFQLPGYRVSMPLTGSIHVDRRGWAVKFDRPATGKLSGNWTTDLGEQAITDEFEDGAFVLLFFRTGNGGQPAPYAANAAEVDRVTVRLGS